MGVPLTVEVHADIAVGGDFLCLRQRISLACAQTQGVFIIQIVFEIQAGQEVVFLNLVASFRTATVYIIVYFHVYLVIFHSQVYNPTGIELVGSFRVGGMDILRYRIFIQVLLYLEPAGREILLIVVIVEREVVQRRDGGNASYGEVVFRSFEVIVYKAACIAETDIRDFFYIIFQPVDEPGSYIQVVFIQSGEISLLGVASEQGVSVFRFCQVVDAAVRFVAFHYIIGSAGVQAD